MSELEISIGLLLCVVVCAYYRIKPKMMSKKELIEKYYKTNKMNEEITQEDKDYLWSLATLFLNQNKEYE